MTTKLNWKIKLSESKRFERALEIFPGAFAWLTLTAPFIAASFWPTAVAFFILAFNTYWFFKALHLISHLIRGYKRLTNTQKIDWLEICRQVQNLGQLKKKITASKKPLLIGEDLIDLEKAIKNPHLVHDWRDIWHVVVIATFRESIDILQPTLKALVNSNFPKKRIMIVLAGEDKDPDFLPISQQLEKEFTKYFPVFLSYAHKKQEGEVKGKGPGITYAGRGFKEYFDKHFAHIPYENVVVTNLDADHIVHPEYLARLTFKYIINPNRTRSTYQPVPLLFNNVWDTPAPNRVVAVGASFWQIVEAMRPWRLKTFASHAQSLETLAATDFWSVKTIVEDGHQFWRTYFTFDGDHTMVPLFIPIYQDCVLAQTRWLTFKAQYLQRRRWAWGVSDFPFIVKNFLRQPNIPFVEKFMQTFRHFGGLYSWATASFLIAGAWIPLLFNRAFQDTVLAHNVNTYAIFIIRLAWIGIFVNVWIYLTLLPKRPKRYGRWRHFGMIWQWALAPVVAIFLSSLPALDSQTRLMIGKYLDDFDVTPKVRKA